MAKRPCMFYSVGILAFLALALQLSGDIYPGWMRVRRDMREINEQMLVLPTAGLKEVDVIIGGRPDGAHDEDEPVAMPQKGRGGHDSSSSEEDNEDDGVWFAEFLNDVAGGDLTVIVEHIEEYEVSVNLGFIFSKVCIHRVPLDPRQPTRKDHHKHKCDCKNKCTKDVLNQFSFMFKTQREEALEMIQGDPHKSDNKVSYWNLSVMKCMPFVAVAFTFLGLVFGLLGFRKEDGCRCFRVTCMLCMLFAVPLIVLPVTKAAIVNYQLHSGGVHTMCPTSVIVSGIGALFAAICFLVTLVGICKGAKRQAPGQWYKFNNELAAGKKPSLVFLDEALPEKVDLGFTPAVSETDPAPQENCGLEKHLVT